MALATIADVMDLTGKSYTDSEVWQLSNLLETATKRITNYTGQMFTRQEHVWKPRSAWKFTFPQRPDVEIVSVQDTDGNDLDYTFDGVDTIWIGNPSLIRFDLDPLANLLPRIVLTYVAGYEIIPMDVIGVCVQMAVRAFGADPAKSGFTQESITSYSYQQGSTAAAGAVGMLPAEMEALKIYRRMAKPIVSRQAI